MGRQSVTMLGCDADAETVANLSGGRDKPYVVISAVISVSAVRVTEAAYLHTCFVGNDQIDRYLMALWLYGTKEISKYPFISMF